MMRCVEAVDAALRANRRARLEQFSCGVLALIWVLDENITRSFLVGSLAATLSGSVAPS
jgi:hypothetical protein